MYIIHTSAVGERYFEDATNYVAECYSDIELLVEQMLLSDEFSVHIEFGKLLSVKIEATNLNIRIRYICPAGCEEEIYWSALEAKTLKCD